MTAAERATAILAESGAVIRDSHIVYTSGRHGSAYVNKDAVYPHTERVRELCALLADAARPLGRGVAHFFAPPASCERSHASMNGSMSPSSTPSALPISVFVR